MQIVKTGYILSDLKWRFDDGGSGRHAEVRASSVPDYPVSIYFGIFSKVNGTTACFGPL
jgi:hypothetical protein